MASAKLWAGHMRESRKLNAPPSTEADNALGEALYVELVFDGGSTHAPSQIRCCLVISLLANLFRNVLVCYWDWDWDSHSPFALQNVLFGRSTNH